MPNIQWQWPKLRWVLLLLALVSLTWADETFLTIHLQGMKVGYVRTAVHEENVGGEVFRRTDSTTRFDAKMLGAALGLQIEGSTWNDAKGATRSMRFQVESGGRSQTIEATFLGKEIRVAVDNSGNLTTKTLDLPEDAPVTDDAVQALLTSGLSQGSSQSYYVFDPMTVTLVKTTAKLVGPVQAQVNGVEVQATLIEVSEPRAVSKVYLSAKGDLIKIEGPMGMLMIPATREEALAASEGGEFRDLASLSRIVPDKPIPNPSELRRLRLRISGVDLSRAPGDDHQSLKEEDSSWTVETHPWPFPLESEATISSAAQFAQKWVRPSMLIPSDDPNLGKLASGIIGQDSRLSSATLSVVRWVNREMSPNAGIGVLRDAREVLATKEGVCRDYAILTAALLRATGIPTRLVSGLVYQDGAFYYHAWCEVFDGKRWFGVDATRPTLLVSPGHIKLSQGSVEDAYLFTFLDGAKIEVLESLKKRPTM